MPILIKSKKQPAVLSLQKFNEIKNKVLVYRNAGGLGDIFMHRMIFEDIKLMHPEIELTFACPPQYIEAVKDHPFLDGIVDFSTVDQSNYGLVCNTSSACTRYEMGKAPFGDKNRSDIWAEHCGIILKNHNMHIHLTEDEIEYGRKKLADLNVDQKPTVFLAPISAMATKNLQPHHMQEIVTSLREMGYFIYVCHHGPIDTLIKLDVPILYGQKIRQWMSLINAADYVLSVDTAAFHFAGGTGKPVTGIFTWADGYIYGKHYPSAHIVQFHRDTHPEWKCGPCYAWTSCNQCKTALKPCLTELTSKMIIEGFLKMVNK